MSDLHAVDRQSAYALWRRVLDFDLMAEVTTPGLPLDHPLTGWAEEAERRHRDPDTRSGRASWTSTRR